MPEGSCFVHMGVIISILISLHHGNFPGSKIQIVLVKLRDNCCLESLNSGAQDEAGDSWIRMGYTTAMLRNLPNKQLGPNEGSCEQFRDGYGVGWVCPSGGAKDCGVMVPGFSDGTYNLDSMVVHWKTARIHHPYVHVSVAISGRIGGGPLWISLAQGLL